MVLLNRFRFEPLESLLRKISLLGDHDIEVKYGGVPVTAIPFTCRAYDPTKIKVGAIPKGLLDKPVYFTGSWPSVCSLANVRIL